MPQHKAGYIISYHGILYQNLLYLCHKYPGMPNAYYPYTYIIFKPQLTVKCTDTVYITVCIHYCLYITLVPTTINLIESSNMMVGEQLTLQCVVDTVENITSRVDIVWRRDGTQLERTNNVTGNIMNGSVVYSDLYMFGSLATSDNGTIVECEVVINVEPPVRNTATTVIVVFGKCFSILVCYFAYMYIDIMCMYYVYIKSYVCTVPTPTVTISPPGPLQEEVGDPLSINCTVRTLIGVEINAVMIMWLDAGGNLVIVDDRVTINDITAIDNCTFFSSLNFEFLMEGDYGDVGNYTCNVMILDASGSDSTEIQEIRGQCTMC